MDKNIYFFGFFEITCRPQPLMKKLYLLADIELVEIFLAGNKRAFEVLYERHYNFIQNCCLGIVKNKSIAQELTQETFSRVLCKIHYFRNTNFKGWIWTIAFNLAINEWKRIKRKEKKVNSSLNPDDIQSTIKNDPLKNLQDKEIEHLLLNALKGLPELTRKCIIEHYCDETSCIDIAEAHQLSLNHVYYRLRIGLQFLRKKLEGLI